MKHRVFTFVGSKFKSLGQKHIRYFFVILQSQFIKEQEPKDMAQVQTEFRERSFSFKNNGKDASVSYLVSYNLQSYKLQSINLHYNDYIYYDLVFTSCNLRYKCFFHF